MSSSKIVVVSNLEYPVGYQFSATAAVVLSLEDVQPDAGLAREELQVGNVPLSPI